MAITQAAIKSSKLYYEYLKATGGGVSSCRVRNFGLSRKNGAQFVLFLDGAVRFIESANIRISGKDCTRHQITILEYDSKNKILIVQPRTEFFSLMVDASPNEVEVVSNLFFLIERVENWYKEYGRLLTIPKTFPLGTNALQVDSTKLSNDQISAVSNALSNRLSYIWGAPGTGKTRNVLMECVMQYFRADKQVLILAPTNNSLEQTLDGILEKLQQEEIELNGNVLRLGIASTEFYGKYPEVCEDITIARKISDLEAHIHAVNAQMDEISALINAFDEHQRVYDVSLKFDAVKNIYPSLFSKWSSLCKNIIEMQSDLPKCEVQHSEIIAKIEILSRNKEFAERKVAEDCKRVNKISNSLWEIGRKRAEKELDLSKTNLTQISIEVEQLRAKEFQLYSEIQRLSSVRESTLREENQTWEKLCCLVECIPSLTTKLRKEKSRGCEVIRSIIDSAFHQYEYELKKKIRALGDFSQFDREEEYKKYDDLKTELDVLYSEKTIFEEEFKHKAHYSCRILAATIDTFIGRIKPDESNKFEHIFLDEAGYCSLIKGATIAAYSRPITLLGDHMQLPPVCEFPEEEIHKNPTCRCISLWAQSALCLEQVLTAPAEKVFNTYIEREPLQLKKMIQSNLNCSYRFGEGLAKVLAEEVYTSEFHGLPDVETELQYITVPKKVGKEKRTNLNEVNAIVKYVKEHLHENIGIITPYKNQLTDLKQALRPIMSAEEIDSVVTVHGSQGREWDTVLFSVVDTTDKWFTDSLNKKSNGKKVINTAVSRAKKKLIIVCDADYWNIQPKQLIYKLLSVAEKIP